MPAIIHSKRASSEALLMDISGILAESSTSVELCRQIPSYLSQALGIEKIALSVVRHSPQANSPMFLFSASAHQSPQQSESLQGDMVSLHHQTKPLMPRDEPMLRLASLQPEGAAEVENRTVFSHRLDETYRMLLVVDSPISDSVLALLQIISTQLAKYLLCLVSWECRPWSLGGPFEKLSGREWQVLRCLHSDLVEKQIAPQLGMSRHTVHTHIKSIYRQLGVTGRLSLLQKVSDARRVWKMTQFSTRVCDLLSENTAQKAATA